MAKTFTSASNRSKWFTTISYDMCVYCDAVNSFSLNNQHRINLIERDYIPPD